MRELIIVCIGVAMLIAVSFFTGVAYNQRQHPDTPSSQDSAMTWISPERLNNIRQASRDMEVISTMLEMIYQEAVQQEARADSLQNLMRSPP